MEHHFEFIDGKLNPIKDPSAYDVSESDWRWEKCCELYGFSLYPEKIGYGDGGYVQIYGPSGKDVPYAFLAERTFNSSIFAVWCKGFPELEGYLGKISPELIARASDHIRETLTEASEWLFLEDKGLFSEHVVDYWRRERDRIMQLREKRNNARTS